MEKMFGFCRAQRGIETCPGFRGTVNIGDHIRAGSLPVGWIPTQYTISSRSCLYFYFFSFSELVSPFSD